MKNYKLFYVILPLLAITVSVSSCSSLSGLGSPVSRAATDAGSYTVDWSWYTQVQGKDYSVVDIIVLRDVTNAAFELMEAAKAVGGDGIINVRLDTIKEQNETKILAASGVVIKYKETVYEGESESGEKSFASGPVSWSKYTTVPSKAFTVVGIVTAKCELSQTPAADLMEAAKKAGAHDVINILVDNSIHTEKRTVITRTGPSTQTISTENISIEVPGYASGVAIKYNDQSIPNL
jgi:uncharacterized protein YbjQ (UPF0145 family)